MRTWSWSYARRRRRASRPYPGGARGPAAQIVFKEEDGIDYAPTTVQTPGGERVPFLFTVKELVATGAKPGTALKPGFEFGGSFKVPSYRTGLFLDPIQTTSAGRGF